MWGLESDVSSKAEFPAINIRSESLLISKKGWSAKGKAKESADVCYCCCCCGSRFV